MSPSEQNLSEIQTLISRQLDAYIEAIKKEESIGSSQATVLRDGFCVKLQRAIKSAAEKKIIEIPSFLSLNDENHLGRNEVLNFLEDEKDNVKKEVKNLDLSGYFTSLSNRFNQRFS